MTFQDALGMLPALICRLPHLPLVLLLATVGCAGSGGSGTETGNPLVRGKVSYAGVSSLPEQYGVRQSATIATVDRAWLDLGRASVSRAGGCGLAPGDDVALPALGIGDHAAGAHNFTAYEAQAAKYCSFGLPFELASDAGAAPEDFTGHSLLLEGTLADGTAFSLASSQAPTLELEAPAEAFELDQSQPDVLVTFDFGAWLSSIDFSAAKESGGRIVIDDASNTELLQRLEMKLASGVALYRDRDGDGALDAEPELLARGH